MTGVKEGFGFKKKTVNYGGWNETSIFIIIHLSNCVWIAARFWKSYWGGLKKGVSSLVFLCDFNLNKLLSSDSISKLILCATANPYKKQTNSRLRISS